MDPDVQTASAERRGPSEGLQETREQQNTIICLNLYANNHVFICIDAYFLVTDIK